MKKQDLIAKLQALPDDADVKIFDHLTNLNDGGGEPTSAGLYSDFDVHMVNDDLDDSDKEYMMDMYEFVPKPFIALTFDNPELEHLKG